VARIGHYAYDEFETSKSLGGALQPKHNKRWKVAAEIFDQASNESSKSDDKHDVKDKINEGWREYQHRSKYRGLLAFANEVFFLSLYIYVAVSAPWWWLQLIFSALAGVVIAVMFVVGHDAAHNSLTPYRWLNRAIARMAFFPSLHPLSLWVLQHNRNHHRWTNLSPQDDTWVPLSMEQYNNRSWPSRILYRLYRGPLGPLLYYHIEIWLKWMVFPWPKAWGRLEREHIIDSLYVLGFACGYLSFLYLGYRMSWFGGWFGHAAPPLWSIMLFGAALPFYLFNLFIGLAVYLHHTHPAVRWYNDEAEWRRISQADHTVHVYFPGPINKLFRFIMEHNIHHLRPTVPYYNLKKAQHRLEEKDPERFVIYNWTLRSHWDVAKRCKLYDFDAKRWTNFKGEFTSDNSAAVTSPPVPR